MRTNSRVRYLLFVVICGALTVIGGSLLSCSGKTTHPPAQSNAAISVSFDKSSLVNYVDVVQLRIIVDDEVVFDDQQTLVNGSFDFGKIFLPVGTAAFVAEARELESERVLFASEETVVIRAGQDVTVGLVLKPAVPMARLKPYRALASLGSDFQTTLHLHNIERFRRASFQITYDSDLLSLLRAAGASAEWDSLSILTDDLRGVVTITVERISDSDETPGVSALLSLAFETLNEGETLLDLEVNSIDDNNGPVPELTSGELYVDDQIVLIGQGQFSTLNGTVTNASDGLPIAGAQVVITGPASRTTTTDLQGYFEFTQLPFGEYQLAVSAQGHISSTRNVSVSQSVVTIAVALSEPISEDQYRIVLTWGEEPADLDAHIWTTIDLLPYEVYWNDMGSAEEPPFIVLDVDDVSSFGPETVTIYQLLNTCQFAVHNFSGEQDIKVSQARIEIYRGSQLLQVFTVPTSGIGRWWYVFDLQANGTIVPRNVIQQDPPVASSGLVAPLPLKESSATIESR